MNWVTYTPASLNQSSAALGAAFGRLGTMDFTIGDVPARLEFFPSIDSEWAPELCLGLSAGGYRWMLELKDDSVLALNPKLSGLDLKSMPVNFRAAALDWALEPLWENLSRTLGDRITPDPTEVEPSQGQVKLDFILHTEGVMAHLRLIAAEEAGALWLQRVLNSLPASSSMIDSSDIVVPASLLAGRMWLSLSELTALEFGDILLPSDYPAANGRLILEVAQSYEVKLAFNQSRAEVTELSSGFKPICKQESQMSQTEQNNTEHQPNSNLDEMEMLVNFELEHRRLTLSQLKALAPGAVFPLGVDPLGPVTLACGGKSLAKGRLVEMGGVLGVQVTEILKGGERG